MQFNPACFLTQTCFIKIEIKNFDILYFCFFLRLTTIHTYSLTNVHIQKQQYFCLKLIQYLPTQRYKHAGSYNRIS